MFSRKRMAGFARFVLGVMLFAQAALAVAAGACSQRAPAQAIAAMQAMPCCQDDEAPNVLDGNANICFVHCTNDAQNVDTSGLAFPALAAAAVLPVSPAPASGCFALRRPSFASPPAAPSLTILLQNFRI